MWFGHRQTHLPLPQITPGLSQRTSGPLGRICGSSDCGISGSWDQFSCSRTARELEVLELLPNADLNGDASKKGGKTNKWWCSSWFPLKPSENDTFKNTHTHTQMFPQTRHREPLMLAFPICKEWTSSDLLGAVG